MQRIILRSVKIYKTTDIAVPSPEWGQVMLLQELAVKMLKMFNDK